MLESKTELQARLHPLQTLSEALQKDPARALADLPEGQQADLGELLSELVAAHPPGSLGSPVLQGREERRTWSREFVTDSR